MRNLDFLLWGDFGFFNFYSLVFFFFFEFKDDIYWQNTWDYIYMRRVLVYWTIKLWNAVTFKEGPGNLQLGVFALSFVFYKAAIVDFIKAEFLRNINLFYKTIPPFRIPFHLTFIESSQSMTSKMLYLYDLRNIDFYFFLGIRSFTKSKIIYFLRHPSLKWASVCSDITCLLCQSLFYKLN